MHANLTAQEWVNINTVSYYTNTKAHRHATVFKNNLKYNKSLFERDWPGCKKISGFFSSSYNVFIKLMYETNNHLVRVSKTA